MACGEPPEGRASWTLKLLADQLVECEIVGTISTETVRQALKKKRKQAELVHPARSRITYRSKRPYGEAGVHG